MSDCRELFLEDVVEISVHPVKDCQMPFPFSVAGILAMSNVFLSDAVMVVSYDGGDIEAVEGSISAKCTVDDAGSGSLYRMDITASAQVLTSVIAEKYNKIGNYDHYICLKKRSGEVCLCYTLPNTFAMKAPITIQGGESCSVSLSTTANSYFIPITTK